MTTLAIQKQIISKLKETKDKSLLESIYKLFNLSEENDDVLIFKSRICFWLSFVKYKGNYVSFVFAPSQPQLANRFR